jgi:DNA adenine methylase
MNQNAQPFVKWVGGKRSLLPEILSAIPPNFHKYYEPFVGGGAVFFGLYKSLREGAALSDTNLELILTYSVIQQSPDELIKLLKQHSAKHSNEYYYQIRKQEPKDPIKIAARFLYLNKTCFNGLYRVNSAGKFNSPIGNYKNPNIVQEDNIRACHEALQNVEIIYDDFSKIAPSKGDFVYFDPPYHPTVVTSFIQYTEVGFSEKNQIDLRDFIVQLHKRGVFIMLSNSNTDFIQSIYKATFFNKRKVKAPRFVNCKPQERDKVTELLITNY